MLISLDLNLIYSGKKSVCKSCLFLRNISQCDPTYPVDILKDNAAVVMAGVRTTLTETYFLSHNRNI